MTTPPTNPRTPSNDHGRFVWLDLMTQDVVKATGYYSELFGWKVQQIPMGEQSYNMIHAGDEGIGGVMALEEAGIPSHWINYVSVPDVSATVVLADKLGGKVCVPPTAIPSAGTFAIITDPQGGIIAPFQALKPKPPVSGTQVVPGKHCWTDLWTSDPVAATKFYGEVFGWETKADDMGGMGTYYLQSIHGVQIGGIMKSPSPEAPPYWCPYFGTENADETTERAVQLSGNLIMPATDIPKVGRFSIIADPTGAIFSVFQSKASC